MENLKLPKLTGPSKGNIDDPKKIIIFIHGYGANGDDLISIADIYKNHFKDYFYISPHAPFTMANISDQRYWFALANPITDDIINEGIDKATPILENFINNLCTKYSLSYKDIILFGFSQGAMLAMNFALFAKEEVGCVCAFSGRLGNVKKLNMSKAKPPIFISHGNTDFVVPFESLYLACEEFDKLNIPYESYIQKSIGHTISMEALEKAKLFIEKHTKN